MNSLKEKINSNKLPAHVAIIMDGNGRWAQQRGLDRIYGHQNAIESVRAVTEAAAEIGLKYLTLYTFSTENWNRPQAEVDALMDLLVMSIQKETPTLNKNNVRLDAIGDFSRLPQSVAERLQSCIDETSKNTGLTLVLALSYSSRWEILEAARKIAIAYKAGDIALDDINEQVFSANLTTASIPDPDLIIRTSGEQRISNFLLWQIAYAEFYFTQTHWPDFRKENLYEALVEFQNRERRYGKTGEQINK